MGIQSDLVVAKADEAPAVAASPEPTLRWDGFCVKGLDSVMLCTLICLARTGHPDRGFDESLDRVQVVISDADQSSDVWLVPAAEVAALARIASLEDEAFEELLAAWCATDEIAASGVDEWRDLLREIGDLAETASLRGKVLLLRMGP